MGSFYVVVATVPDADETISAPGSGGPILTDALGFNIDNELII